MFAIVVAVVLFVSFGVYVSIKERDVEVGLFVGLAFGIIGLVCGFVMSIPFAAVISTNDENIAIETQKIELINFNEDSEIYVSMQMIDNQWHYRWCYVDENDTIFLKTEEADHCRIYYSNKENPRVYIQTYTFKSNVDNWLFGAYLMKDTDYVFYIPEGSIVIDSLNIKHID